MSLPQLTAYPHVPNTVSPQAQAYLRTTIPFGTPIRNLQEFEAIRKGFAAFTKSESERAVNGYVREIKKTTIEGVDVYEITPKNFNPENGNILIYIHGGAYTFGSADHLMQVFAQVADKANLLTFAINYRLAPEYPFPAGLNDCLKAYLTLQKIYHATKKIFLLGDSAGGALVLSMLLKARDEESLPMPTAIGLFSPMAEAEKKGDTFFTHEGICPVLIYDGSLKSSIEAYVPQGVELNHPYISPVNANFRNFPPTMIVSGTRDLFLSSCARLEDKMSDEGVKVVFKVFEGMGHGFQERLDLPEAIKSRDQMANFFLSIDSPLKLNI